MSDSVTFLGGEETTHLTKILQHGLAGEPRRDSFLVKHRRSVFISTIREQPTPWEVADKRRRCTRVEQEFAKRRAVERKHSVGVDEGRAIHCEKDVRVRVCVRVCVCESVPEI